MQDYHREEGPVEKFFFTKTFFLVSGQTKADDINNGETCGWRLSVDSMLYRRYTSTNISSVNLAHHDEY